MSEDLDRFEAALSNRYRLGREIGSGGMATVYLAEDLKHDREVAVKVLRPELASAIGADRFLREIKFTAKLNHPHILPLFFGLGGKKRRPQLEQLGDRLADLASETARPALPKNRGS